jgi:hypothetical protein
MIHVKSVTCPSQVDISLPQLEKYKNIINLRMPENKEIIMVNLSNVTHTRVCGTTNEQVSSTTA